MRTFCWFLVEHSKAYHIGMNYIVQFFMLYLCLSHISAEYRSAEKIWLLFMMDDGGALYIYMYFMQIMFRCKKYLVLGL